MNPEDLCLKDKCPNSCCLIFDGVGWVPCKWLEGGLCSIYEKRLNVSCGNNFICRPISENPYSFPNCPYNTGKPMHPAFNPSSPVP